MPAYDFGSCTVIREVFVNPAGFIRVSAIVQQIRHKQSVLAKPLALIEERPVFPGRVQSRVCFQIRPVALEIRAVNLPYVSQEWWIEQDVA